MPLFSANIALLFDDRPMLDRFAAAAAFGFDAVEVQFPYEFPVAEIAGRLADCGLPLASLNLDVGDMLTGGPGLISMPGREDAFRAAVARTMTYAEAMKPGVINMLAGWPPASVPRQAALDVLAANLRYAAQAFRPLGIKLVLEAVNTFDRPGYLIDRTADAIAVIDAAGAAPGGPVHGALGILFDIYHMHLMEGGAKGDANNGAGGALIPLIERHIDRIYHVQFADAPGRHQPGTGDVDLPPIFAALDRLGYAGYVGAEYNATTRTEDTLGWMAQARAAMG